MKTSDRQILTINGGSSSIKFGLFEAGDSAVRILRGAIDGIGMPGPTLRVEGTNPADNFEQPVVSDNHTAAVGVMIDWIDQRDDRDALIAVGHRVVHGGPTYSEPQRITAKVLEELRRFSAFDPEHLPEEIRLIDAFQRRFPDLPQVETDAETHRSIGSPPED